MSVMSIMSGAVRVPWPKGAEPCPNCGNHTEILIGDVQCIEHYQCPCGWFSMRSGGYTPEVHGWNTDVKEERIKRRRTLDRSLDESEVDAIVAEVCDEIGIAHE